MRVLQGLLIVVAAIGCGLFVTVRVWEATASIPGTWLVAGAARVGLTALAAWVCFGLAQWLLSSDDSNTAASGRAKAEEKATAVTAEPAATESVSTEGAEPPAAPQATEEVEEPDDVPNVVYFSDYAPAPEPAPEQSQAEPTLHPGQPGVWENLLDEIAPSANDGVETEEVAELPVHEATVLQYPSQDCTWTVQRRIRKLSEKLETTDMPTAEQVELVRELDELYRHAARLEAEAQ